MFKPEFVENEIYHIYNRGVEKRNIFLDKKDYLRFVHDLFEFNNKEMTLSSNIRFASRCPAKVDASCLNQCLEVGPPNIDKPRKLLVEILAFCLMPNHYHLLLKQKSDDGIIKFMQKTGTGYVMYFNQRYERVGPLYQGRFKAVIINRSEHFDYIPYYIHFNPLDLIEPNWRDGIIKNYKKTIKFLNSYRWSSHLDYLGKKNFPSVTQREFLLREFQGEKNYKANIKKWFKEITQTQKIDKEFRSIILE